MKCPICKKPVAMGDPYMPFCSERCRLIDLGKWADEDYRIPSESAPAPTVSNPESDDGENESRGEL